MSTEDYDRRFSDLEIWPPLDALIAELALTGSEHLAIKIDAEGMELEVLEGARHLIGSHSRVTLVAESKHIQARELTQLLGELGFTELVAIDEHNTCAVKHPDVIHLVA